MSNVITTLDAFNRMSQAEAIMAILPCNGSRAWAAGMEAARPFHTPAELFAAADRIWEHLPPQAWQQAFDSHPRIGEKLAVHATKQSLEWSAGEQAAALPDEQVKAALAEGNREYEQRFNRIFIVCATGKTAAEMLTVLRSRLHNDPATELNETAEQQRQITQIRLHKWLGPVK
jgi:2-oxo-4-hydroxy-4-carboxy-5-ureidoimidazoline decarboxylase